MMQTVEQTVKEISSLAKVDVNKIKPWQSKSQFDCQPPWWETIPVEQKLELAKNMPCMNGNVCQ